MTLSAPARLDAHSADDDTDVLAAAAVDCRDPESGLRSLEPGRGVLWSQLLDVRADLHALHRAAPALAEQVGRVRDGLAALDDRMLTDPEEGGFLFLDPQ